MSTKASSSTLLNFFIFSPKYGPREGEEEKKIMFYYPKNMDIDTQIKNIGLSEAIVKFSETFSDKPCECVHTQKTRQLFLEPEPEFWMAMTVSIPYSEKVKDGHSYIEYREEDVQDSVYAAVLKQAYRMFQLFNGTFENILQQANGDVQILKQRLEHFYERYLLTLRMHQSDILDVFNGIHFLPLDKNTYLRIQCFINQLEATFPSVKYTAFLYNDQLVWSGLEQDDMRIMYKYLTTSLFPTHLENELQGVQPRTVGSSIQGSSHLAKFVTGPVNLKDEGNLGKIPRVFINTEEENEECQLLVYKALSASICMLINVKSPLTFDLCRKLDGFLAPQMSKLASDISEVYSKKSLTLSSTDPQFKYIYFNHMNLAQKTTVHIDIRKLSGVNIPQDTLRLLADINADLTRGNEDGETIVKTLSDYWVVGKKSDQREFYVVINQKNANLIDINEEVKKLCTMHLNNVFFLD
ncbi:vacuolar fusion protein CCZ1 homolog [Gigantopelta aegis]|uniref:vacuolar fusion protein CCZ1 homolog n=1 Tax=Gigantopelta aegis TaxID=1735272 RepID=UPI001B88A1BD|nr:vacuolar fusion protein CCZ1 homolog [Gigantopelta aegis]